MVKILLAALLITLAASNRYISIPSMVGLSCTREENDRTLSRLVHKVRAEALIIAALLVCTAFLIHNTPAKHASHAGHGRVHGITE
jgi:putative copper export protein